ncbi:MAG: T9SS type A sorting domain-containing protein [Flavobacteriaceae bacterium]|nr:T9SS type A sorting domain-containing protein [Flavobacteriaceae bacterium]
MKQFYKMKKALLLAMLFIGVSIQAQEINFYMDNEQVTGTGPFYYEFDVMITSTVDFKLGSGQLYFNYSSAVFGTNISTNGGVTYSHGIIGAGSPYILDQDFSGALAIYNNFIQNDNTTTRLSVSFGQVIGDGGISANNVTSTPTQLMHVSMLIADVNQIVAGMVCFETNAPFDNLFFTTCGGAPTADCTGSPGSQITVDTFVNPLGGGACSTLSTPDTDLNTIALKLYPNPSPREFVIESDITSPMSVTMHDISGKQVNYIANYEGDAIDVSQLQAGVYLVSIEAEGAKTVKRLIIQ